MRKQHSTYVGRTEFDCIIRIASSLVDSDSLVNKESMRISLVYLQIFLTASYSLFPFNPWGIKLEEGSLSDSLSDLGENSHSEFEPFSRKRLWKRHSYDDDWEEDTNEELKLLLEFEPCKKAPHGHRDGSLNKRNELKNVPISVGPKLQEAF